MPNETGVQIWCRLCFWEHKEHVQNGANDSGEDSREDGGGASVFVVVLAFDSICVGYV